MLGRQIEKQAKAYQTQLLTSLLQDEKYIQSTERLAELEIKERNFDHVGHIARINPNLPIITGLLNGALDYSKDYKKHSLDKEINEHKNFLAQKLKNEITKLKPDFKTLSAYDALAYEYFLTTLETNYLNTKNNDVLANLKQQARVVSSTKSTEEIRQAQEYMQKGVNLTLQANMALLSGQQKFETILKKVVQVTAVGIVNQHVKMNDVEEKLDRLGVKVDENLHTLIQTDEEVKESITTIDDFIKEQAETKNTQKNYRQVMEAAGFITDLGRFYQNENLYKAGVAGQAFGKLYFEGKDLYKKFTNAKELSNNFSIKGLLQKFNADTITSLMSVSGAIFAVISLFGHKKQQPNPNDAIMRAIRSLANEIYNLNLRFDHLEFILSKMGAVMVSNFCQLRLDNFSIKEMLDNIQKEIKSGHRDIKETLNTLTDKLHVVANRQRTSGRQNKISDLYLAMNKIMSVHQITASDFKDLYNKLKTEILNVSKNDIFLVGEAATTEAVVKTFEEDVSNVFFADFNIAPLYRYLTEHKLIEDRAPVANPAILCWEMLAMMELMQKRYKQSDKPEFFISKAEVEELHQIFQEAMQTKVFITDLKSKTVLEALRDNYSQASSKLQDELNKFLSDEEEKLTKSLNQIWQKEIDTWSEPHVEAFKRQAIDVSTNHANWFGAYSINYHHRCFPQGIRDDGHHGYADQQREQYKQNRIKDFNTTKEDYLSQNQNLLLSVKQGNHQLNNNKFKFFTQAVINTNMYHGFIYPEDATQPILAMPSHFRPKQWLEKAGISAQDINKLLEAEWLGIGRFKFKYAIQNQQFVISMNFVEAELNYPLVTLSMAYNPKIFTANEAILSFWFEGNFNADGSYEDRVVHTLPTVEENVWVYRANIPKCSAQTGQRNSIKIDQMGVLQNAQLTKHFQPNSLEITTLQEKVKQKRYEYEIEMAANLKENLERNDNSDLAKALISFSYHFNMLQSALFLSYKDHPEFNSPEMKFFINGESKLPNSNVKLFRNRLDFLNILAAHQGSEIPFSQILDENLEFLNTQLPEAIASLAEDAGQDSYYQLFEHVLNQFSEVYDWYTKHAVDENTLVSSVSNEKNLSERANLQEELLKALGRAVATVANSKQQEKMFELITESLAQKGLLDEGAHWLKAILPAPQPQTNSTTPTQANMKIFTPVSPATQRRLSKDEDNKPKPGW